MGGGDCPMGERNGTPAVRRPRPRLSCWLLELDHALDHAHGSLVLLSTALLSVRQPALSCLCQRQLAPDQLLISPGVGMGYCAFFDSQPRRRLERAGVEERGESAAREQREPRA